MVNEECKTSPIVIVSIASCCLFYGAYCVRSAPLSLFLGGLVLLPIVLSTKKQQWNTLLCCLVFAFFISALSLLSLYRYKAPVKTLARLSNISRMVIELASEPKPAGSTFVVDAVVKSVAQDERVSFSATGHISVFFPKAVIEQTLAGGISTVKQRSNEHTSRLFVRGAIMEVKIKPVKKGTDNEIEHTGEHIDTFFADSSMPRFIGWTSPVAKVRGHFRFAIMRLLYSWGACGALLLALVSADKSFLSPDVYNSFIDCGLAHVLALSGMHISLVNQASQTLTKWLPSRILGQAVSLVCMALFVWFAGSSPSLNRALGMAFIATIGRLLRLPVNIFNVVSAMFIIHILFLPHEALTLSFMLSYGALVGILVFGEALNTMLDGKVPPILASSFSASFGAQAFTIPIISFTIKRITLVGLISSTIVSPLIGIFLLFGFVGIFSSLAFPTLSPLFNVLLNYAYNIILGIVRFFEGFFVFDISNGTTALAYSAISIMLGCACIYCKKNILNRRNKLAQFTV